MWASIHGSSILSWSSHFRNNDTTTRAISNNYASMLGQWPWTPCRSALNEFSGHNASPGGWDAYSTSWAFLPMAPQVPGVTPGSPLCPWYLGHSLWRGVWYPHHDHLGPFTTGATSLGCHPGFFCAYGVCGTPYRAVRDNVCVHACAISSLILLIFNIFTILSYICCASYMRSARNCWR